MSSKKLHDSEKKALQLAERFKSLKKAHNLNDTDLAIKLGLSRGYIGNISARKVPGKGDDLWSAVRKAFPNWESYLRGDIDTPPGVTYQQEEEHMLPRKEHEVPDSGPGQLRLPDMSEYRIVKLVEPEEGQWQRLHVKLDQILLHLARQDKRLKELEKKAGIEFSENEVERRKEPRGPSLKPR
jgi:transcriptional regulator with XRE-family HTH domain